MLNNILAARNVLPAEGWCLENITGREFVQSDLGALAQLGAGDPFFTWERELKNYEYFEKLLTFRLNHYRTYSFGVHGIWLDGELIGQCGLQVFDEKLDRVECVVFLGKAYARKGMGWRLTRYLVSQCKTQGMSKLFGVARPDNFGAIALMRKLQAVVVESVIHFEREANVFCIDLNSLVE